jgi:hypothetical protein
MNIFKEDVRCIPFLKLPLSTASLGNFCVPFPVILPLTHPPSYVRPDLFVVQFMILQSWKSQLNDPTYVGV